MHVEKRTGLTYTQTVAFINSLNIPNVSISGQTITIANYISIRFAYQRIYITIGSGSEGTLSRTADGQTVWVAFNNNVFYMQVTDSSNRRGVVMYEKLSDNTEIYGYAGTGTESSTTHVFYNIEDISFKDFSNANTYSHAKRLNYTDPVGYIDYTQHALFVGGYKGAIIDPNFMSCSTITSDQSVAVDGANYWAIGTNTLIEIDPIE